MLLQYDAKRSGTGGVASADYLTQSLELWTEDGRISVAIKKDEPLKIELAHFINAIGNGKEPSPSGEEGKYVLSVAIAAIASYHNGNTVRLNA